MASIFGFINGIAGAIIGGTNSLCGGVRDTCNTIAGSSSSSIRNNSEDEEDDERGYRNMNHLPMLRQPQFPVLSGYDWQTGIVPESPETTIARTRPDLAARVLRMQALAGIEMHGNSQLAAAGAAILTSRTDLTRVRMRSATTYRILKIPVASVTYKGEIKGD